MTIISHKYKFIFLKTGKTAGTSVEMALEPICGEQDICAPITVKKTPRPGEESHRPRNHTGLFLPCFKRPYGRYASFSKEIKHVLRRQKYTGHMTAIEVRSRLPRKIWEEYFKFTIVRNPWDYAVSKFFFAQRHKNEQMPFEEWIRRNIVNDGMGFYSLDGEVAVDHVLRYETLEQDLEDCLKKLGIEEPPKLPRAKAGFRPKNSDYREVHTEETRKHVAEVCRPMIDHFGYTFE